MKNINNPVQQLLHPYTEGKSVIIHSGRDLYDLEVAENNQISPIIEILRSEAFLKHNLIMIEFSKSSGVYYDLRLLNEKEKTTVSKCINDIGLTNNTNQCSGSKTPEFVNIIRGLIKLSQSKSNVYLRDGVPLKFLVLFHFSDHLTPHLQNGTHTDEQIICIETALKLTKSLSVRKYGNYVIFSEARQGTLDSLIYQNVQTLTLPQPGKIEKSNFFNLLKNRYPNCKFEEGITDDIVVNMSSGTPNRSIEQICLASEKTETPVSIKNIYEKKQSDIISLSEKTLNSLDEERIKDVKLVGENILKPMQILMKIAESLRTANKNTLRNVLLAGAPSTGKTMLANIAASKSGVPSFSLNSPKDQYVGESERKARLMFSLLKQLGGFGIIDELDLLFPLNRNQVTGDSGVTQNLQGQLQTFLSDPSLSGKTAIIGTSNRPGEISEGMRQRWIIIPVLMALESDYPNIVESIAKSINSNFDIGDNVEEFISYSKEFYRAGASPREIYDSLNTSILDLGGEFNIKNIEHAAKGIIPSGDIRSSIYSDYCALAYCRNNSFLPWWDTEKNMPKDDYQYPAYIKEILTVDLKIDHVKLNNIIRELHPYANV